MFRMPWRRRDRKSESPLDPPTDQSGTLNYRSREDDERERLNDDRWWFLEFVFGALVIGVMLWKGCRG